MSRNLRFVAPLLLIAAVAMVGCGEGGGGKGSAGTGPFALEKAPADDLATMCPEGALAFIRISSFQKLENEVVSLVKAVEPDEVDDASILKNLGMMMGNPTLDGMAVDKPAGIALFVGSMGPMPVVIMPLSDKAAFGAKVGENPGVKVVGEYGVWAPDPSLIANVKAGGEVSKLAASLMAGDIAIAVDMNMARPLLAPMYAQMDQVVEMINQQMPGPVGGMYGSMATGFKQIMNDAGEFGIVANLSGGKLDLVYRYAATEGTETAKMIATGKTGSQKSLIGYIDSADFMAMEMKGSGEDLWNTFGSIYESMFAGAPEALEMMKKSMMLIDGQAVGISIEGGLSGTVVTGVTDEKAYAELLDAMPKAFGSMMESMKDMMPGGTDLPMDMSFAQGENWKHAGVTVRTFSFTMAMKDMPDDAPPEAKEAMAAMAMMFEKTFGGETIDYHIALVDGHAVGVVGANAKDRTSALIDKVKSGSTGDGPASFVKATEGFPGNTDMVFSMDFASVLKMMSAMPEMPPPVQKQFANPPAGLGMSAFLASDEKSVSFGMRYDLKTIVDFIASFMPKPMK